MELWIRSQDKKMLEKINGFEIVDGSTIQVNGFHYGTYKKKERALEVIDEIQSILKPVITYTQKEPIKSDLGQGIYQIKQDVDLKIQQVSTYVYEMPKE